MFWLTFKIVKPAKIDIKSSLLSVFIIQELIFHKIDSIVLSGDDHVYPSMVIFMNIIILKSYNGVLYLP